MSSIGIKYRYALDDRGQLVDIACLSESDRKDYICAGCGNILRPVLPRSCRQKHFRHKCDHNCSVETYLHRLGKILFEDNYKRCLQEGIPYEIEYQVPILCDACDSGPCETDAVIKSYDLTKQFKTVLVEKRDGEFIPDVLIITSSSEKIYIEIAVTHMCTSEKVNSGERIIEFYVNDEDGLEVFSRSSLTLDDHSVDFYNYKPTPIMQSNSNECKRLVHYFIVFPSGKCRIATCSLYEFNNLKKKIGFYFNKVPHASSYYFANEVERAYKHGIKIRNCYLCRYHAEANWYQSEDGTCSIFCKTYRKSTISTRACDCDRYRVDPKVFPSVS